MAALTPIYTPENSRPAYQLTWSLTVFWNHAATAAEWLDALTSATEPDGVRILEHRFLRPGTSQFLVSTRPSVSPRAMVRCVKGRLQYLVRGEHPRAFRHKHGFRSVGWVKREDVERYVRTQASHHPMADPRVQAMFERHQVCDAAVDLSGARQAGSGVFWYNLHIVLVHAERFCSVDEDRLEATRRMILKVSERRGYLLSRAGILADHVHLAVGCPPQESPQEIALRYMNNLAYAWEMKRVFGFGYYVGTFGEYDLGVIPSSPSQRPAGASPAGAQGAD